LFYERRKAQLEELEQTAENEKELKFMNKWFQTKYLANEQEMLPLWQGYCSEFKEIEELSSDEKFSECLNFNHFMAKIFPKYMQVCWFEYANAHRTKPLLLDKEQYLGDLPVSVMTNLDDFKLFEHFLDCDIEIEVIRAVKH